MLSALDNQYRALFIAGLNAREACVMRFDAMQLPVCWGLVHKIPSRSSPFHSIHERRILPVSRIVEAMSADYPTQASLLSRSVYPSRTELPAQSGQHCKNVSDYVESLGHRASQTSYLTHRAGVGYGPKTPPLLVTVLVRGSNL